MLRDCPPPPTPTSMHPEMPPPYTHQIMSHRNTAPYPTHRIVLPPVIHDSALPNGGLQLLLIQTISTAQDLIEPTHGGRACMCICQYVCVCVCACACACSPYSMCVYAHVVRTACVCAHVVRTACVCACSPYSMYVRACSPYSMCVYAHVVRTACVYAHVVRTACVCVCAHVVRTARVSVRM